MIGGMTKTNLVFPLFDSASADVQSKPFYVLPGWAAEIMAFGFSRDPVAGPDGMFRQAACLHSILYKVSVPATRDGALGVAVVERPSYDDILAEGPMVLDCCPQTVGAERTHMYLTFPGDFRLVLNDPEALGVVQVYLRAFPKGQLGMTGG
jgi:hypothetical protein